MQKNNTHTIMIILSNELMMFRSMVEQLEKVDPGRLKHEEKLAFWINIYNALLMHVMISQPICESCKLRYFLCILLSYRYYSAMQAYLAYGIPRNNLKRMTLLQRVRLILFFIHVCIELH